MKKRILSLVLCFVMLLSLFPVSSAGAAADIDGTLLAPYGFVKEDGVYKLQKDLVMPRDGITLNGNAILDLNGHMILQNNIFEGWEFDEAVFKVTGGATVVLKDSVEDTEEKTYYIKASETDVSWDLKFADSEADAFGRVDAFPGTIIVNTERQLFKVDAGAALTIENVNFLGEEYVQEKVESKDGYHIFYTDNLVSGNPIAAFNVAGTLNLIHVNYQDMGPLEEREANDVEVEYDDIGAYFLLNTVGGKVTIEDSVIKFGNDYSQERSAMPASSGYFYDGETVKYNVENLGTLTVKNSSTYGIHIINGYGIDEIPVLNGYASPAMMIDLQNVKMYAHAIEEFLVYPFIDNYGTVKASGETRLYDLAQVMYAAVIMENGSKLDVTGLVEADSPYYGIPAISVQAPTSRTSSNFAYGSYNYNYSATVLGDTGDNVRTSFIVRLVNRLTSYDKGLLHSVGENMDIDYVLEPVDANTKKLHYSSESDIDVDVTLEDVILTADDANGSLSIKANGFKTEDAAILNDYVSILSRILFKSDLEIDADTIGDTYLAEGLNEHLISLLRLFQEKIISFYADDDDTTLPLRLTEDSAADLGLEYLKWALGLALDEVEPGIGNKGLKVVEELYDAFPYTEDKDSNNLTISRDYTPEVYSFGLMPGYYYSQWKEECYSLYSTAVLMSEGGYFVRTIRLPGGSAAALRENEHNYYRSSYSNYDVYGVYGINESLDGMTKEQYGKAIEAMTKGYYFATVSDLTGWELKRDTKKSWPSNLGLSQTEIAKAVSEYNMQPVDAFPLDKLEKKSDDYCDQRPATVTDLFFEEIYIPSADEIEMAEDFLEKFEADVQYLFDDAMDYAFSGKFLNFSYEGKKDTIDILNGSIVLTLDCTEEDDCVVGVELDIANFFTEGIFGTLEDTFDFALGNKTVQRVGDIVLAYYDEYLHEQLDKVAANEDLQAYISTEVINLAKDILAETVEGEKNPDGTPELYPNIPENYEEVVVIIDKLADIYLSRFREEDFGGVIGGTVGEYYDRYFRDNTLGDIFTGELELTELFTRVIDDIPEAALKLIDGLGSMIGLSVPKHAEGEPVSALAIVAPYGGILPVSEYDEDGYQVLGTTPVKSISALLNSYGIYNLGLFKTVYQTVASFTDINVELQDQYYGLAKAANALLEEYCSIGAMGYRYSGELDYGSLIVLPTSGTMLANVEYEFENIDGKKYVTVCFVGSDVLAQLDFIDGFILRYGPKSSSLKAVSPAEDGKYYSDPIECTEEAQDFDFTVTLRYDGKYYDSGLGTFTIPSYSINNTFDFTRPMDELFEKNAEEIANKEFYYESGHTLDPELYDLAQVIYCATETELNRTKYPGNTLILKNAIIDLSDLSEAPDERSLITLPDDATVILVGKNSLTNDFGGGIYAKNGLTILAEEGGSLDVDVSVKTKEFVFGGICTAKGDLIVGAPNNVFTGEPELNISASSNDSPVMSIYCGNDDIVIEHGIVKAGAKADGTSELISAFFGKSLTVKNDAEVVACAENMDDDDNMAAAFYMDEYVALQNSAKLTSEKGNNITNTIWVYCGTELVLNDSTEAEVKIYKSNTIQTLIRPVESYLVIRDADLDSDSRLIAGTFSYKPLVREMAENKVLTADYNGGKTLYTITDSEVDNAPHVVGAATTTKSEVATTTNATLTNIAAKATSEASLTNIQGAGLVNASAAKANENTVVVDTTLKNALKNATGINKSTTELAIVIQTYADVTLKDISVEEVKDQVKVSEITFEITPWMQKVVTTKEAAENEEVDNTNSYKIGEPEKLVIVDPVIVYLPLPEEFVAVMKDNNQETAYVKHTVTTEEGEQLVYIYEGTLEGNMLKFVNPDGFSEFTVSITDPGAASVGGISYMTLREAFEALQDGDILTILKDYTDGETFVIDREITFTVNKFSYQFNGKFVIAEGFHNESKLEHTYKIVANATVPSSNNGPTGTASAKKTVTVNAATYGSVTASTKYAEVGSIVTLTVTPKEGYVLKSLKVLDEDGKELELTKLGENSYSFTMPNSKVTVKPEFTKEVTMKFVDVLEGKYYYDAVLWAVEKNITTGRDETHFAPLAATKRSETVTFLWRAAGCPEPKSTTTVFTDVKAGSFYEKAVLWGVENDIVKGTSATTFSPNDTITRAQMVTFIARLAGIKDDDTGYTHSFTDVTADKYYNNAVAWAAEKGITTGKTETTFAPKDDCQRGQLVTLLYRYFVR